MTTGCSRCPTGGLHDRLTDLLIVAKELTVGFPSFERSAALQQRLHELVPGGAHTFARGADQFPEGMAPVIVEGRGARVLRRRRQLVRRVRLRHARRHPRARLRAGGRGRARGDRRRGRVLPPHRDGARRGRGLRGHGRAARRW